MIKAGNLIVINDTVYKILSIEEKNYSRIRRGAMERLLRGEHGFEWIVWYKDFHVTAKSKCEDFERTFVFNQQEFEAL